MGAGAAVCVPAVVSIGALAGARSAPPVTDVAGRGASVMTEAMGRLKRALTTGDAVEPSNVPSASASASSKGKPGELPELRAIASYFREHDGEFWVSERDGEIVGCIGYSPAKDPSGVELKKLYVHACARKHGLGGQLHNRVEARARERGPRLIDLWGDTRFATGHAFYERRGYQRGATTRELHDKSFTVEFYFRKDLAP